MSQQHNKVKRKVREFGFGIFILTGPSRMLRNYINKGERYYFFMWSESSESDVGRIDQND